jgi:hypothetical protein
MTVENTFVDAIFSLLRLYLCDDNTLLNNHICRFLAGDANVVASEGLC